MTDRERLEEYAQKVRHMRQLQRRYFDGEKRVLDQCKKAEKAVDAITRDILEPTLFPEPAAPARAPLPGQTSFLGD